MTWQNRPGAWISDDEHGGNVEEIINQTPNLLLLPPASCLCLFLFLLLVSFSLLLPNACCLLCKFALFYAEIASAGFPDPVTSSIPHLRPDWIAQPGVCIDRKSGV